MRKRVVGKKLKSSAGHRRALARHLVFSLIKHGQIKTTLAKARWIRPVVEKLITKASQKSSSDLNKLQKFFVQPTLYQKMVKEIGPLYQGRSGGYTRIVKMGPRQGDAVEMAIFELVEREKLDKVKTDRSEKTKPSSVKDKKEQESHAE